MSKRPKLEEKKKIEKRVDICQYAENISSKRNVECSEVAEPVFSKIVGKPFCRTHKQVLILQRSKKLEQISGKKIDVIRTELNEILHPKGEKFVEDEDENEHEDVDNEHDDNHENVNKKRKKIKIESVEKDSHGNLVPKSGSSPLEGILPKLHYHPVVIREYSKMDILPERLKKEAKRILKPVVILDEKKEENEDDEEEEDDDEEEEEEEEDDSTSVLLEVENPRKIKHQFAKIEREKQKLREKEEELLLEKADLEKERVKIAKERAKEIARQKAQKQQLFSLGQEITKIIVLKSSAHNIRSLETNKWKSLNIDGYKKAYELIVPKDVDQLVELNIVQKNPVILEEVEEIEEDSEIVVLRKRKRNGT